MDHARPGEDERRLYEAAVRCSARYAARHVATDVALEIAHEVACAMVRARLVDPSAFIDGRGVPAFAYRAVINRLRNRHRSGLRRAAAERVHGDDRAGDAPAWANPASALEIEELERVVEGAVAGMPAAMRRVFLLLRDHEITYAQAAQRLTITTSTVHTQLSRANAVIRRAVQRYQTGESPDLAADAQLADRRKR